MRAGQAHAQFLANKFVALGGEPTTQARPVPLAATDREMLEAVLAAELRATEDYTQRAREADALGEKGLAVQLEDMVRDESGHSEETERILKDWPLWVELLGASVFARPGDEASVTKELAMRTGAA